MEEFFKLIPAGVYQGLGVMVVVVIILFKDLIGRIVWRVINRNNDDPDDRTHERRADLLWLERFLDMSQKQVEATSDLGTRFTTAVLSSTDKTTEALRILTETIANLATLQSAHERKAQARHEETSDRLGIIEKHRRRD